MKKFFDIIFCTAVIFFASSCSNDLENNLPQKGEKSLLTFSTDTESPLITRGNFKNLSGDSAPFKWEMNDKIGIFSENSDNLEELSVISVNSSSNNTATLQGIITVGDGYLGIYPKSAVRSKEDVNVVIVEIPDEQIVPVTSSENEQYIDPSALIQIGYTHTRSFTMMTPCSFLKFKTGLKDNIEWVKVTAYDANNNPYGIVGDVTVTKSESSSISLGNNPSSSNSVICKYAGGNFPQQCSFTIAIRPGQYHKLVLEASDGTRKTATSMMANEELNITDNLVFERAYFYPMGEI